LESDEHLLEVEVHRSQLEVFSFLITSWIPIAEKKAQIEAENTASSTLKIKVRIFI